jgi:amino acid transporter
MYLANMLTLVGFLLAAITTVYLTKDPPIKGKPYSRKQKLMMIPLFLAFCCLIAVLFIRLEG